MKPKNNYRPNPWKEKTNKPKNPKSNPNRKSGKPVQNQFPESMKNQQYPWKPKKIQPIHEDHHLKNLSLSMIIYVWWPKTLLKKLFVIRAAFLLYFKCTLAPNHKFILDLVLTKTASIPTLRDHIGS